MDILESQQLYVNEKKCEFCKPKVAYLGHIVSCEGVAVNPEKVQAMVDWPPPRAIKEIRKFLAPQEGSVPLEDEVEAAFHLLKQTLLSTPVLAIPNFDLPFEVEVDASGFGIGAILSKAGVGPSPFMRKS
ncbi:uncharacterized mitochondrial protein AtMg00860-like [Amaranthus tricolor]|uniref:uncharacterized mitochondrial protein AtMg00860-like n=1 Tax=Amaranthus tricolor TaxID=29722 RepID=UPI00258A0A45|nr:uncharacterized mitochondrial protein AtMg00860-like [Amaranthus tricolor]